MEIKKNISISLINYYKKNSLVDIPFFEQRVNAGFPSPADDFLDLDINLQDYLIKHPESTFCVRVNGSSMIEANIFDGDVLIIDRSTSPKDNSIVLAVIDNEFTVKRIKRRKGKLFLKSENINFKDIEIDDSMNFSIWGIVTHIIHET